MTLLAPVALGMGFAIHPAATGYEFDSIDASKEANARIDNYLDVVRLAEQAKHSKDPEALRSTANAWIEGNRTRELMPLYPQTFDDGMQTGVKQQIYSSGRSVATQMTRLAADEGRKGDFDQAAGDYVRAATMLEPLRYSDTASVALVSALQRQCLEEMKTIWPKVSTLRKLSLQGDIAAVRIDPERLEDTMRAERRVNIMGKLWFDAMNAAGGSDPSDMDYARNFNQDEHEQMLEHTSEELSTLVDDLYPSA
jgi:hypothetical protein